MRWVKKRDGVESSEAEGERSFSPPPSRGFLSRRGIRRGNFFTQGLRSDCDRSEKRLDFP